MAHSPLTVRSIATEDENRTFTFDSQHERDTFHVRLAMLIIKVNSGFTPDYPHSNNTHAAFLDVMRQFVRTPPALGKKRMQEAYNAVLRASQKDPKVGKEKLRRRMKGMGKALSALTSAHAILYEDARVSKRLLLRMIEVFLVKNG